MSYGSTTTRNHPNGVAEGSSAGQVGDTSPSSTSTGFLRPFLVSILPSTATTETVERVACAGQPVAKVLGRFSADECALFIGLAFAISLHALFLRYAGYPEDDHWQSMWDAIGNGLVKAATFLAKVVFLPLCWILRMGILGIGWAFILSYTGLIVGLLVWSYLARALSPSVFFSLSSKTYNNPFLRTFDYVFLPAFVHAIIYTASPSLLAPYTPQLIALYTYLAFTSFFNLSLLRGGLKTVIWVYWRARGWETSVEKREEEGEGAERNERTKLLEEENERLREQLRVQQQGGVLPPYRSRSSSNDSLV